MEMFILELIHLCNQKRKKRRRARARDNFLGLPFNLMKFKEIEISKIKNLDSTELVNLYKETRVWFQEGYDQDKKEGRLKELIEKILKIEKEMKERNIPLQPKYYCEGCKKFWNNDPYCPHGFDEDELWELYSKARFGKIKFSPLPDYKKIEFWNKDGNFIGEYYESNLIKFHEKTNPITSNKS